MDHVSPMDLISYTIFQAIDTSHYFYFKLYVYIVQDLKSVINFIEYKISFRN